jgi:succinyl-CoA synthetase beta subunit
MKIHEYQARDLLHSYKIPVPPGRMIESIQHAGEAFRAAAEGSATGEVVIKAQVHAGGRGKAGFVKIVKNIDEATSAASFMLTNRMKSPQTPPEGLEVKKVLIAQAAPIAKRPAGGSEEFYLAITTDRKTRRNILIASREGGVEIETVAHERPDAIIKHPLHPLLGLQDFAAREVAFRLGFRGRQVSQAMHVMKSLAKLFIEKDCTLAEINPLVLTPPDEQHPDGQVIAIDAKFSFDENGLFRHPEVQSLADHSEENQAEARAQRFGLSYIALDGQIGCLVNGAGLAMATMDIIKLSGGEPANFLDVGGTADAARVEKAFRIILKDPTVKAILVNIFGGIVRCDRVAQGVVDAYKNIGDITVPIIVRLQGTNAIEAKKLIDDSGLKVLSAVALQEAADRVKEVLK